MKNILKPFLLAVLSLSMIWDVSAQCGQPAPPIPTVNNTTFTCGQVGAIGATTSSYTPPSGYSVKHEYYDAVTGTRTQVAATSPNSGFWISSYTPPNFSGTHEFQVKTVITNGTCTQLGAAKIENVTVTSPSTPTLLVKMNGNATPITSINMCAGEQLQLTAENGTSNYKWYRPGGTQIGTGSSLTYSPGTSEYGDYKATATWTNPCTGANQTIEKIFTVNISSPDIALNNPGTAFCSSGPPTYSVTINTTGSSNVQYQWDLSNGDSKTTATYPVATGLATNSYTITATVSADFSTTCLTRRTMTKSTSFNITSQPATPPTPDNTDLVFTCGSVGAINVSTYYPYSGSYTIKHRYYDGNTLVSTQTTAVPPGQQYYNSSYTPTNFGGTKSFSVDAFVVGTGGCADQVSAKKTFNVRVDPVPSGSLLVKKTGGSTPFNSYNLCSGETLSLTAYNGTSTYKWYSVVSGQDNWVADGAAFSYTAPQSGSFTLTYKATAVWDNPCSSVDETIQRQITINVSSPDFTLSNPGSLFCSDTPPAFTASNIVPTAASAIVYEWTLSNGTSGANGASYTAPQNLSGAYTLTSVVKADFAVCINRQTITKTTTFRINPKPLKYDLDGADEYCEGTTTDLTLMGSQATIVGSPPSVTYPYTYQLVKDGTASGAPITGTGSTSNYPRWTGLTQGSYEVTASVQGCSPVPMNNTKNISSKPNVSQVVFTSTNDESRCVGSGTTVYSANSTNAVVYYWQLLPGQAGNIAGGVVTWNSTFVGQATITVVPRGCGSTQIERIMNVRGLPTTPTTITSSIASPHCKDQQPEFTSSSTYIEGNSTLNSTLTWSVTGAGNSISSDGTATWAAEFPEPSRTETVSVVASNTCGTAGPTSLPVTIVNLSQGGTPLYNGISDVVVASKNLVPLALSAPIGNVVRWEKTSDPNGQWADWGQAGQTSTSVMCCLSKPGDKIYVRAVVKNGICPELTSNEATIGWNTENLNFIKTFSPQTEITSETQLYEVLDDENDVAIQTTYFDGLGRPIQSVSKAASSDGNDIILFNEYDELGREAKKYLPYTSVKRSGFYHPDGKTEQAQFYAGPTEENGFISDTAPYAVTMFEKSPLNRVKKQGAPGSVWQPDPDPNILSDRSVKFSYSTNGQNEILLFNYSQSSGMLGLNPDPALRYYAEGALFKKTTFDEHSNEVLEYADKSGQTVCKRVQYETVNGVKNYADTYYIYDDNGNLVVVLPPQAAKEISQSLN